MFFSRAQSMPVGFQTDFIQDVVSRDEPEVSTLALLFSLKENGVSFAPCGSDTVYFHPSYRCVILDLIRVFKELNLINDSDSIFISYEGVLMNGFLDPSELESVSENASLRILLGDNSFICEFKNTSKEFFLQSEVKLRELIEASHSKARSCIIS